MEGTVVGNRVRRHRPGAGSVVKVIGNEELVAVGYVKPEGRLRVSRGYNRAGSASVLAYGVGVDHIRAFFSDHQDFAVGCELDLRGGRGGSPEGACGFTQLR